MNLLFIITFICASSSMIYQFCLAQYTSAVFGGTSLFYTLTVGVFTFSLGLGSLLFKRINLNFILIETMLILCGGLVPILLYLLNIESLFIFILLMIAVGFLSGLEIPTIMQIKGSDYDSGVWYTDLLGSAFGVLFFIFMTKISSHLMTMIITNSIMNLIPLILYQKEKVKKKNLFIK